MPLSHRASERNDSVVIKKMVVAKSLISFFLFFFFCFLFVFCFLFFEIGFLCIQSWLSKNSFYRPGWPQIHLPLPPGIKGVCHHSQLLNLSLMLFHVGNSKMQTRELTSKILNSLWPKPIKVTLI